MTNSKILFDNLVKELTLPEAPDEIKALAFEVLGYFGVSKTDILSQRVVDFDYSKLKSIMARLNDHEPLQYILNEAWFCGHRFYVDPSVLIPRPETELLVEVACQYASTKESISILDIGTGSGCIAISLAKKFSRAQVLAIDVSVDALAVAERNALALNTQVQFARLDILKEFPTTQKFDLIVSNPPYISVEEKSTLSKNVLDYEPHLALFAHRDDALIFYRAIANASTQKLNAGGKLIVEINERYGAAVKSIFIEAGLGQTEVLKDISGKDEWLALTKACLDSISGSPAKHRQ